MQPIFLHIENFMCHEKSQIDFRDFLSALIVGRLDGNDLYSNGVGKSTIFKAIEFVLFNESKGLKLEKLVRDGQQKCRIIIDFQSNGSVYRVCRVRTKKGASDLSLFERNSNEATGIDPHVLLPEDSSFKTFWNDISGRRTQDTEEDLCKIHKTNFQGFISAFHFAQDDYNSGLATATPSNRKKILKESLRLAVYTKLHKFAQDKSKSLYTELEKKKAVHASIGNPEIEIKSSEGKLAEIEPLFLEKETELQRMQKNHSESREDLTKLESSYSEVLSKTSLLLKKKADVSLKIEKSQSSINDYSSKRKNVIGQAKSLKEDVSSLKEKQQELASTDFSRIEELKEKIDSKKSQTSKNLGLISSLTESLTELRIPLPKVGYCKHCRQVLSDEHRAECEKRTSQEIEEKENKILLLKKENEESSKNIRSLSEELKSVEDLKKQLNDVGLQIKSKEKELFDKKAMFDDYNSFVEKFKKDLEDYSAELTETENELAKYSEDEVLSIKSQISSQKSIVKDFELKSLEIQKDLNEQINRKAILNHTIAEKRRGIEKRAELSGEIASLELEYSIMPDVIESFGATGIPNLIIQNVLDELQNEANGILEQIKPGLQLNFSVQKTKNDGEIDDDLDIEYFLNGKPRDYAQLSGAQKLSVMFSLKIGVAFLLKKNIGVNIGFLLLDEIDQALDKASVDAFAEIIKFFQKDFKILVITHNDRLKDKLSNYILVEQDLNGTSRSSMVRSIN